MNNQNRYLFEWGYLYESNNGFGIRMFRIFQEVNVQIRLWDRVDLIFW